MTGDDLLFLASNLVANASLGNPESRYRSAISRSYYGAFHIIVAFLEELGSLTQLAGIDLNVPENHTGHETAYRLMFNTDVPEAVDAARCLNDLRGDRNRADYRLKMKGFDSMANAKEKVEIGYAIKALVTKCRADDKIRELVDAILSRHRESH